MVDAITLTCCENPKWCNMVHTDFITRHGICVIILDYGYLEGCERFRSNILALSPDKIEYNTYPAADLLKKYAVTVFFHPGFKRYPLDMLGPGLKGGNPDMKGDFTIVDSHALTEEGKEDSRLLSLNCSDEFLAYLATKPKH